MIAEVQQGLQRRADPAKKTWWENYVKGAAFAARPWQTSARSSLPPSAIIPSSPNAS